MEDVAKYPSNSSHPVNNSRSYTSRFLGFRRKRKNTRKVQIKPTLALEGELLDQRSAKHACLYELISISAILKPL